MRVEKCECVYVNVRESVIEKMRERESEIEGGSVFSAWQPRFQKLKFIKSFEIWLRNVIF